MALKPRLDALPQSWFTGWRLGFGRFLWMNHRWLFARKTGMGRQGMLVRPGGVWFRRLGLWRNGLAWLGLWRNGLVRLRLRRNGLGSLGLRRGHKRSFRLRAPRASAIG